MSDETGLAGAPNGSAFPPQPETGQPPAGQPGIGQPGIGQAPSRGRDGGRMRVDTSELKSSYCNVCNASATREEVVLNFGVNQDWDRGEAEFDVRLLHRVILSPFAAKRVSDLLASIVRDYETRHGPLR